ncbi:MAG: hypothetical protein JXX29_08145 [Deltaproteobacteria bacterium]|nr:hypothetical protein [Deltaproteobacteria bacterium]MBN2671630.1 hypothetical protein [Deltaproteobacteria bacterium]
MAGEYEKPKRSWREIDQRKDQSAHRKDDRPKGSRFKQARADNASKLYKSQLNSFFDGDGKAPAGLKEKFAALDDSKEGKERKAAAKKISDAKSSSAKTQAVKEYLQNWALPPDYALLCEVLACNDEELQEQALDEIAQLVDANRAPKRISTLEQRLKSLVALADDEDIEEKAQTLLRRLRVFK